MGGDDDEDFASWLLSEGEKVIADTGGSITRTEPEAFEEPQEREDIFAPADGEERPAPKPAPAPVSAEGGVSADDPVEIVERDSDLFEEPGDDDWAFKD